MKYIILAGLAILLWILFYISKRQRRAVRSRRKEILERMRKRNLEDDGSTD